MCDQDSARRQQPAHTTAFLCACESSKTFHRHDSLTCEWMYLALFVWTGEGVVHTVVVVVVVVVVSNVVQRH